MKFELRKVKVHEDMSEETLCFSAEIWQDNRFMAYVKNDGHGGCNNIQPAKGLSYKDVAMYDNLDIECEIITKISEIDYIKKNQSKGFLLKKDGKDYISKFPRPISRLKKFSNYNDYVKKTIQMYEKQGYQVLNTNL